MPSTLGQTLFKTWLSFMLLLSASGSWALAFTPIEMDFTPSGRGSTQIYRLENTLQEPVAVEISVKHRAMAINGDDELTDADDDFNIFPAQVVLRPGQVQTVRVQYNGPASLNTEKAYRLIAEQLPIDIGQAPQNGGRMRLLIKYVTSLYVVPSGVRANVRLMQTRLVTDEGKPWLELLLKNEGTSRRVLKDVKVQVGGHTLQGDDLKGLDGENLLAQTQRWFRVAAPKDLNSTQDLQLRLP